jgi:hypothetical protein
MAGAAIFGRQEFSRHLNLKHQDPCLGTSWSDNELGYGPKTDERSTAMTLSTIAIADLKRAIEGRDGAALAGLYAPDAVVRIIDRDNPPSKPRELKGKAAIASFYDDVCGRNMSHKLENGIADGDRVAFTQSCAYPDGTKVFCSAMLELEGGKIARQTIVQAWDE